MWNITIDFPAVVLIAIFVIMFWVFWQAHKADNGLNFSEMLRDEHGKASSARMAIFVCLAISSWAIMYILLTRKGEIDPLVFGGYIIVWSGAKVAEKLVDAFIYYRNGAPATPLPRNTTTTARTQSVTQTQTTVATATSAPPVMPAPPRSSTTVVDDEDDSGPLGPAAR